MSELRELLKVAAPPPSPLDLDDLRRRVRRRRRRRRAAAITSLAAVVLVVASLGVSLREREGGQQVDVVDRPSPGAAGRVDYWDVGWARSVTVGSDGVWIVGVVAEGGAPAWFVAELDPETGKERRRIPTPGVVRLVAVSDGVVWAYGGGDGGEPSGGIVAIDERTGDMLASHGWDEPFSPYAMALAGGHAWVSSTLSDEVLRVRLAGGNLEIDPVQVGDQPTDIVATGGEALWVRESLDGTIARIDLQRLEVAERHPWPSGALLAAAQHRPDAIWANEQGGWLLVEFVPNRLGEAGSDAVGTRIQLDAEMRAVAPDRDGVWLATQTGILRYSIDGQLVSQWSLEEVDATSLAADSPNVWFIAGDGRLGRWSPAAARRIPPGPAGEKAEGDGP